MKFKQIEEISLLPISIIIEKLNSLIKEQKTIDLKDFKNINKLENSIGLIVLDNKSVNENVKSTITFLKELNLISIDKNNILYKISPKIKSLKKDETSLDEKIRENISKPILDIIYKNKLNDGNLIDENKFKSLILKDLKEENINIKDIDVQTITKNYISLFKEILNNDINKKLEDEKKVKIPEKEKLQLTQLSLF